MLQHVFTQPMRSFFAATGQLAVASGQRTQIVLKPLPVDLIDPTLTIAGSHSLAEATARRTSLSSITSVRSLILISAGILDLMRLANASIFFLLFGPLISKSWIPITAFLAVDVKAG